MTRIKRPSAQFPDGAADVARRFGITIKTLRLYESAGLLAPVRDAHGWRTYGQAECERLHVILLLRRFGLTIARIGALLDEGAPDVAAVLDLQEQALIDQRNRVEDSLILIAHARCKLRAGGTIDATALAELARAEPLRLRWTPALRRSARAFLPPLSNAAWPTSRQPSRRNGRSSMSRSTRSSMARPTRQRHVRWARARRR